MNPATLCWYLPLIMRGTSTSKTQPLDASTSAPYPSLLPPLTDHDDNIPRDANHSAVRLHPFSVPMQKHTSKSTSMAKQTEPSWEEMDAKFRRDLPDESYVERLVYRGMVMRACPKARVIDGVTVSNGERDKADKLLTNALRSRTKREPTSP
jgi:protein NUD1